MAETNEQFVQPEDRLLSSANLKRLFDGLKLKEIERAPLVDDLESSIFLPVFDEATIVATDHQYTEQIRLCSQLRHCQTSHHLPPRVQLPPVFLSPDPKIP